MTPCFIIYTQKKQETSYFETQKYKILYRHISVWIRITILHILPTVLHKGGGQGFWGSGENGYLFSGSWGALVIIFGELGSKLIILGI